MKTKIIVLLSLFAAISSVRAITIAQWTFETSVPTTQGPLSPEVGSGTATASIGGTISNPLGNGSNESWSSTGWNVGDYWQFQVDASGLEKISLRWDQTSSATGSRDFGLFWSLTGVAGSFAQFGVNYAVLENGSPNPSWSSGTPQPSYSFTRDLSSVAALANDSSVFFRLILQTDTQADGVGTVPATGASRIDNFTVIGDTIASIPDTGITAILLSLSLLGLFTLRRLTIRPV